MKKKITEEPDYDIRYSTTLDGPPLLEWVLESRKWFPPNTDNEVELFVRNWIGFSRYQSSLTAVYQGEAVGIATVFLMPYLKVAHLCMMYMVVNPKYRRMGVGASLVRNIKHLAKTKFRLESMHVEVFEGCDIVPLLEQNGFDTIVKQNKFVKFEEGYKSRLIMETKW